VAHADVKGWRAACSGVGECGSRAEAVPIEPQPGMACSATSLLVGCRRPSITDVTSVTWAEGAINGTPIHRQCLHLQATLQPSPPVSTPPVAFTMRWVIASLACRGRSPNSILKPQDVYAFSSPRDVEVAARRVAWGYGYATDRSGMGVWTRNG
jgi:hypothetical protein